MIHNLASTLGLPATDPVFWLPLSFFGLFIILTLFGLVLDGFDVGLGCLSLLLPHEMQTRILALLNPWRDANELWLFMGLGLLATAFPGAWGALLGQLFLPALILALGVFLRSLCYEWRLRAPYHTQGYWAYGFGVGSLLTAIAHGLLLAQIIVAGRWTGGYFWFSLLIAACTIAAYILLGACWLVMREREVLRARGLIWARRVVRWFAAGVVAASVVLALENAGVFLKWTLSGYRWVFYLYWCLLLAGFLGLEFSLRHLMRRGYGAEYLPFLLAVLLFWAIGFGFVYSFFPFYVLDQVTVWDAAAPLPVLWFVGGVTLVAAPFLLLFNIWVYGRLLAGRKSALAPKHDTRPVESIT